MLWSQHLTLNPKFRVTVFIRKDLTKGPGTLSAVKRLFGYTDGSRMQRGTGAGYYGQFSGRRLSISLGKCANIFRPRYIPSWTMHFKFVWMLDQKNKLVFSLTARRLWNLFRLPKQRPHWYNCAKRRWTIFPPDKKDKMLHGNPAYMAMWRGLISTQKQVRKLISGNSPTAKNRPLSFNRTQSRAVTTS